MSRKLLAVCMFASLFAACSNSGNSLSPSPTPPSSPASLRDFYLAVRSDVENYWNTRFQATSLPYRPLATMQIFSGSAPSRCGRISGPAYCPPDFTAYLEESFMAAEVRTKGDFAAAVIIAHEIGHHVQNVRGLDAEHTFTIEQELQADCLAGAWTSSEGARGLLHSGDLQEAARSLFSAGDSAGTPWYEERAHGSAALRIRAFTTGLKQPTACF